ncbi:bromodomain-containing protein DDB_G0270170-like isoform X2 [Chenopodium quinoa]|uniref:bromodomain-containing protein DDB_G0270170-like isoform X2 n=1 Tax=Chenopodium quinoa TaxID=63459 RepID=UPI000B772346|nr:bromodomain-containing protein DDB_G0270170-like isoform X2 [Chenopodium quinoa]
MVRRTAAATTAVATLNTGAPLKKKKGRPSLADLQNRALLLQQQQQNPNSQSHFPQSNPNRRSRSARRIPNLPARFIDGSDSDDHSIDSDNLVQNDDDDDDNENDDDDVVDDDDDERAEKKVKLVVQFPNSSSNKFINAVASQDVKRSKATDNDNGTRRMVGGALENGPTPSTSATATATSTSTPLPDKKLLLLILDKLQKKDTRGVFAEPVDPEELPDYHEIIENPMDFETVRKKLLGGLYVILQQLEDDINLICSNAMKYNSPSTVFHRQARAIQELAKKEFETLKQDGGVIELPAKPRRGRPPGSRNLKKLLQSSPPDRNVRESSSDATPASRDVTPASRGATPASRGATPASRVATPASQEEDVGRSGSYNLRKGPSLYRFPRYLENCFDFSGSSSKSMSARYGKKSFGSEESRRDTYYFSGEPDSGQDQQMAAFGGLERQLIPVALASDPNSYARSLAQFAAKLGPDVWKVASKKIRSVLPPGVEFGPGWVGETKVSSAQLPCLPENSLQSQDSFNSESHHLSTSGFRNSNLAGKPTTSCPEKPMDSRELSSNVEWSSLKGGNGVVGPGHSLQVQHQGSVHPRMNGFSGSFAPGSHFQEAIGRQTSSSFFNPHALDSSSFDTSRSFNGVIYSENDMVTHGMPYWQNLSIQESWDRPYPVELNKGFQASGSKSTNLPIGSPPQLDLVLQL